MKKIKWATHKSLFAQIASSACLVGASAGVVFGVSAGTFKVQYFDLKDGEARVAAYNSVSNNYSSQNITSQWNMNQKLNTNGEVVVEAVPQPKTNEVTPLWWETFHDAKRLNDPEYGKNLDINAMNVSVSEGTKIDSTAQAARKKYSTLIIDGSTHSAMDRSFNQGLMNGLANFNTNIVHDIVDEKEVETLKPAQDTTQEFINIYRAAAKETAVLALAGFNHVTPINALGNQNAKTGVFEYGDKDIKSTGLMLMDGDVANNQNVASVLFRSDQPAFLTALATCMYFYNNLDIYHEGFKDLAVGGYGGTAIPTVTVYLGGFQRGLEFFNEFILKNVFINIFANSFMHTPVAQEDDMFFEKMLPASKYKDEIIQIRDMTQSKAKDDKITEMLQKLYDEFSVKMIKLGNFGTHFSGSFAAGDAIGVSKQLLNRGASAIIAVAGPQSLDTAQEIMNQNKSCIVIGVDSAMERSDYQKPFKNTAFEDKSKGSDQTKSAQANNIIKFSAVKDMTSVSDKILRLASTGKHYDVESSKPWQTRTPAPVVSSDETTPIDSLNITYGTNTFNINGLKDNNIAQKELVLPVSITKENQTYYLNNVSGFTTSQLANVESIKLKGHVGENQKITFEKGAFTFTKNESNLEYIDFSDVPVGNIQASTQIFTNISFENDNYNNFGYIKLGDGNTTSQETLCKTLLGDEYVKYIHKEADPYKSICSFGYKTCGNIENGLISISWDGWAPLIQCLKYVNFYDESGTLQTFKELWNQYATTYCDEAETKGISLPDRYRETVCTNDIASLITYDTQSPINKGYSHTMNILGNVLANTYLDFAANMTVELDSNGVAHTPQTSKKMSILEWLKLNMYFTV